MTAPAEARGRFSRHPRGWLFVLVVIGCLLSLVVAELAARAFLPSWTPARNDRRFWHYDSQFGWGHTPGQRGIFEHRDFSVDVVINSQGLRDDEYSPERNGKKRMLVLGDSFAWGFGVQARERFSEILEARHPEWEIINAAVSGYGTDQEFLFLRERGIQLRPDVVLLLFCSNDFENNLAAEQYWHYKPLFTVADGTLQLGNVPVPATSTPQLLKRWLLGRTYLGRGFRMARESVRGKSTTRSEDVAVESEITARLIRETASLCDENGARFVLLSAPLTATQTQWLANHAAATRVPYLPLDIVPGSEPVRFAHDEHWTPAGHAIAAAEIDDFLGRLGVFAPREP